MVVMYILGINCGLNRSFFHDSSACLLKDGKIVAFVEQERFDRVKHSHRFPKEAIEYCLRTAGIGMGDVDEVAMDSVPRDFLKSSFSRINKSFFTVDNMYGRALNFGIYAQNFRFLRAMKKIFPKKELWQIPHHLSHAASTYYVSGFKKANILTVDGRGENESTVFYFGDDGKIEKKWGRNYFDNHSFGVCYGIATQIIKMGKFGEGKTMGLAPYGKPTIDFSDTINYNGSSKKALADFSRVRTKFSKFARTGEEIKDIHKNLAASLQESLENTLVKITQEITDQTGNNNLCLAGGVALNCKANGTLIAQDFVKNIYVQPAAGDDGGALGSALQVYASLGYKPKFKMEHAYWGPEFSNDEIKSELKQSGFSYEYHDDISGTAAELIGKHEIVGWFQGRMEVGPRALGNRSILSNPTTKKMTDKVNDVKRRERWRPLAPSILEEAMGEYFENPYPSPFMILSFQVKDNKIKEVPAIVHVDGSTRPQSVTKRTNRRYYDLIKNFEKISSTPIVMNTSFNDRGEPIVCTPKEALNTFKKSQLKYLAIGNFLVKK